MALTLNGRRIGIAAMDERQMEMFYRRMAQFERQEAIRLAMLDFGDALTSLKNADPEGWESWYDDNENIPEEICWESRSQVDDIIRRIRDRIEQVTA